MNDKQIAIHPSCINHTGSLVKTGLPYGRTQFMGKQYLAHRLAYAANRMIHPDSLKGIVIRHTCDNPSCINVEHLVAGSQKDNMQDKVSRGRHLIGEFVANSKLKPKQIKEIKTLYKPRDKNFNQYALAIKYGVSQSLISNILSNKKWKHIKE